MPLPNQLLTAEHWPGLKSLATKQPAALIAGAAWAGIVIGRWLPSLIAFVALASSAIVLGTVVFMMTRARHRRRPVSVNLALMIIPLFVLFAWIGHISQRDGHEQIIAQQLNGQDQPTIVVARIDQAVRWRRDPIDESTGWIASRLDDSPPSGTGYQSQVIVRLEQIRSGREMVPSSGRVLVRIDAQIQNFLPGDCVRLLGTLSPIRGPTNPGQRDPRTWAHRQHVSAIMRVDRGEDVQLISRARLSPVTWVHRSVAYLAGSARDTLLANIAPQQRGIAMALVLGQRDLLDRNRSEDLLVTGTAHLLSVSGLHLGIVLVLARWLAMILRTPMRIQWCVLVVVAIGYVLITGGRPPVLRAALLLAAVLMATTTARNYHPLNSLCLAATLLAGFMPLEVFAVGMQLSFLAVATLFCCGTPDLRGHTAAIEAVEIEQHFDQLVQQSRSPLYRGVHTLSRLLVATLWYSGCVTVITLPIIWYTFHVVSPVSVLVNVMLSPLVFVALAAGIATVLTGWTIGSAAWIPAWACSQILSLMESIIELARLMPWGHFWLPSPPLSWVFVFYGGVLLVLARRPRTKRWRFVLAWSLVWCLTAWWMATSPSRIPVKSIEVTFLDVGHGTAAILRDDEGTVWLYDCGWLGNAQGSSHKIDEALWSMGITKIDAVCLSHADSDHFNAMPGLIRKFGIGVVLTPPGMLNPEKLLANNERLLNRTARSIHERGIPVLEVDRDCDLRVTNIATSATSLQEYTSVLHPPATILDASDNANSLVLAITHPSGRTLVLPGDLEPPGTSVLVDQARPSPGGVMMAPHHGSLNIDADAVLHWGRPSQTVVSGGRRANRPAVKDMLASFGSDVHVTAQVGAIRVRIVNDGQVQITAFNAGSSGSNVTGFANE